MAPRLIRRRPLLERIKDDLDPIDFLFRLLEKFESNDWDALSERTVIITGFMLNLCFILARANSGYSHHASNDEVFGDDLESFGWSSWLFSCVVHLLSVSSAANAFYTFSRRRHYRLFESSINDVPTTPSAHRVKVQSSPVSSSPLRFFSGVLAGVNTSTRSQPDANRDVWEIGVWDPKPICIKLFCMLSPGHVLIYWLFLPTAISDPRPSTTVVLALLFSIVLSVQLRLLYTNFSQQSKDISIVQKEVMHEYDTKFVHPSTQHLRRDVGTQFSTSEHRRGSSHDTEVEEEELDLYTPSYILNKGFHVRPSPSYAHHVEPDSLTSRTRPTRGIPGTASAALQTPSRHQTHLPPPSSSTGGSLGVYTHAHSPLRRSTASSLGGVPDQQIRNQKSLGYMGNPSRRKP